MESFDTDTKVAVLQNELKNLSISLQEFRDDSKQQHKEMLVLINEIDTRLSVIEQWRWMVFGGSVVLGYLLSNVKHISGIFS